MKKIFLILSLFILLTNLIVAFQINPFIYDNNGGISETISHSSIEGKNLYSEILIQGYIQNKTLAQNPKAFFSLTLYGGEPNQNFKIHLINISVCDGKISPGKNYHKKMDFTCNKNLNFNINNSGHLKIKFNLSDLSEKEFSIGISYFVENFVILNGNYEIAWLKASCTGSPCPEKGWITRTLTLPSPNLILESWNNFEIIDRSVDGRWVLKTYGNERAMVWYRDAQKEIKEKSDWLLYGVFFSLLASLFLLFISTPLRIINKKFKGMPAFLFLILFLSFILLFALRNKTVFILTKIVLWILFIFLIILFVYLLKIIIIDNRKEIKKIILDLFYKIKKK